MKKFGSWTEQLAALFRKNSQAITFRPNQATTYTASRDIQLPPGDTDHVVMSATSTATMTGKTFDANGSGNSISNIENADIAAGAAIAYSKLALTGEILSADIAAAEKTGSGDVVLQTSPTIASPTVTGTLLLQNPSGSQPELHFSEDPDNGTNVVKLKAPATLAGDVTLTLPPDDGDAGEALVTDGSGGLTFEPVVTDPTTTRGDIIRRGAAVLERLAAATDNRVVAGDGTDVVSKQIDDPAFFSSGAAATPTAHGVVTTYVPTIASAVHTVSSANYTILDNDGFNRIQVTTGASNRTITLPAVANNAGRYIEFYKADSGSGAVVVDTPGAEVIVDGYSGSTGSFSLYTQFASGSVYCDGSNWYIIKDFFSYGTDTLVFSFNGIGGNTGSLTLRYTRTNNLVTMTLPDSFTATTGISSTTLSATTVPTWARPSVTMDYPIPVQNNSTNLTTMGRLQIASTGVVTIFRDYVSTAFTDASTCGLVTGTRTYTWMIF